MAVNRLIVLLFITVNLSSKIQWQLICIIIVMLIFRPSSSLTALCNVILLASYFDFISISIFSADHSISRLQIITKNKYTVRRKNVTAHFWTRKRVPNGHERCSCCCSSWGCCYQICDLLRLFHFTTIVAKLCIQIGDNIIHNRNMPDFL